MLPSVMCRAAVVQTDRIGAVLLLAVYLATAMPPLRAHVSLPAAWLLPMPLLAANVCIFAAWPSWCATCWQHACLPERRRVAKEERFQLCLQCHQLDLL